MDRASFLMRSSGSLPRKKKHRLKTKQGICTQLSLPLNFHPQQYIVYEGGKFEIKRGPRGKVDNGSRDKAGAQD